MLKPVVKQQDIQIDIVKTIYLIICKETVRKTFFYFF